MTTSHIDIDALYAALTAATPDTRTLRTAISADIRLRDAIVNQIAAPDTPPDMFRLIALHPHDERARHASARALRAALEHPDAHDTTRMRAIANALTRDDGADAQTHATAACLHWLAGDEHSALAQALDALGLDTRTRLALIVIDAIQHDVRARLQRQ